MKILILRFSSIGDIVLTTPVVRCLKNQVSNVELHYATKQSFHSIVASNPYIDKIHLLENSLTDLIAKLKSEQFDLVIDLHNNLRTSIIKLSLGVKSYAFPKLNIEKWLLTNFKINKLPDIHIVDRYLSTAKSLGVINDGKGLDYFIPSKDEVKINEYFSVTENNYIAFVIGAKFATKQLPTEKILKIIENLSLPVVLLGGKEDEARGEELVLKAKGREVFNACGKFNLNQSASIVKQSKVVITHDTGLMHIASAFQKKIVSVWGNTVPALGMYPYVGRENSKIIEVNNLNCRPCSKIGYDKCPKGHFDCMNKINENELLRAVEEFC
jgi:ADP-heptose:LPS heptosyltransferase